MTFRRPWEPAEDERKFEVPQTAAASPPKAALAGASSAAPRKRINIRQKGQSGERQVATELNLIVNILLAKHGIPVPVVPVIQRNQNQSAVGGSDLSNTFGIAIEIKRQEQLSINTWWRQCTVAAEKNGEFPVLIYRQNKQAWRVVMYSWAQLPPAHGGGGSAIQLRMETDWESFKSWFRQWVDNKLSNGELPKV